MPPTDAREPRIPEYDFAAPTEADALAALQRVFGGARGFDAWAAACRDAGLAAGSVMPGEELERAAAALERAGGAASTVGRSLVIRMRTYTRLAARRAAVAGDAR